MDQLQTKHCKCSCFLLCNRSVFSSRRSATYSKVLNGTSLHEATKHTHCDDRHHDCHRLTFDPSLLHHLFCHMGFVLSNRVVTFVVTAPVSVAASPTRWRPSLWPHPSPYSCINTTHIRNTLSIIHLGNY